MATLKVYQKRIPDDSSSDEDEADNKQKFNENKTERSKVSKEKKKPIAEKATSSRQLPSRSFSRSRDLIEKPKSAQQLTSAKSSRHSSSAKSSPPPKSNSSSRINLTGKPNPSPHRKDDVRLMPEKAQSSKNGDITQTARQFKKAYSQCSRKEQSWYEGIIIAEGTKYS
eukprot:g7487.t1 g7487   contig24:733551-734057(-)